MNKIRACAAIGALALLATACGSDEESADTTAAADTSAPATTAAETTAPADTTAGTTGDTTAGSAPSGEFAELCALAQEMDGQDGPPTAEQMTQYQALAPEELRGDIDPVVEALVPLDGDMVAFIAATADDELAAHLDAIDAFEVENCGIESDNGDLPEGASLEVEEDAQRVDVTATDFEFAFESPTEAGRTSFVLTNDGAEAHFLLVVKLAEGVTLQQALETEDPEGMIEGQWETHLAAPGGDEEAITFDLEPGNYGMACFLPTTDGTPHAFLGMTSEFTIAG